MKNNWCFFLALLFLSSTLLRCGDAVRFVRGDSASIAGVWKGVPTTTAAISGVPVNIRTLLRLDKNKVSIISICEYPDGEKLSASVSSCAVYYKDTILVRENKTHIENVGTKSCSAEIDFSILRYSYSGETLIVESDSRRWVLRKSEFQTAPSSIPYCGE